VIDFTLPELGEDITSGDVLRVMVKPGDIVAKDQPILELETDKATIEVPSSVAGQVKEVKVKAGDKVKVGQVILSVDQGAAPAEAPAQPARQAPAAQTATSSPRRAGTQSDTSEARASPPPPSAERAVAANTAARVPDDSGLESQVEGARRVTAPDKAGVRPEQAAEEPRSKVVEITRGTRAPSEPAPELSPAPAAPSVRRMARELGVDITEVVGSGPSGRISIEDVKAHAKRLMTGAAQRGGKTAAAAEPLPDFSRWGEVDRQPMRAVRRKTAEHLTAAWAVPHVTQHDLADITALEELRKRFAKEVEAAGGQLTVTAIAVKVVAAALKVFPQFNASLDLAAEEIVYKKYVNVGVAVDTDRGLLVPVIRDADTKNLTELSVELSELAAKARTRKITLDEMRGGTFSVSNLGGIGGTAFTPIINVPEVAILGISRARMEPLWRADAERHRGSAGGAFVPRLMLPLSLSYDHRAIDGADGIRFLRWVVEALEQPFLLALHG